MPDPTTPCPKPRLTTAQRMMIEDAQLAEKDAGGPRSLEVLAGEGKTVRSLVARGLITLDKHGFEYRLTDAGRALSIVVVK